tara:strand:- start:182 stop:838 length:657 start_codon:yes stop_codon:yes gene_type:complete
MATTSYALMHGSQFAKEYVTAFLTVDLPTRLIEYRNGWQIDDSELPVPTKFLSYEPIAIDAWPTVITVAISTSNMEQIGNGGPSGVDPVYRMTYAMRTYAWVRTAGSEATTLMRDRLTTVIRSALLDRPCLKATDPLSTWNAGIQPSSLREEFSDLTLLKGERVMAGAYLGYDLNIDEVVSRADIGTVGQIKFGVKNTPPDDITLNLPTDSELFQTVP